MTDIGAVSEPVTAGMMLKQARELAGLHVAALAVSLKVPVSKLEALEADHYDALPDATFVRALASSVCRTLKIDPAPVLALLPAAGSPHLSSTPSGLNTPVRVRSSRSNSYMASAMESKKPNRFVGVLVLVLLVGALGLLYLPDRVGPWLPTVSPQDRVDQLSAVSAAPASTPAHSDVVTTLNLAPSAQSTPVLMAPQVATVEPSPSGVSLAVQEGARAENAPHNPPAALASSIDVLTLSARAESWIQVRDASGNLVVQRKLEAGERVVAAGALPLSVVVGRADVTDIFVRGKQLDISALARENVARFEVK
jgi:cytoskeleton protein RodZ